MKSKCETPLRGRAPFGSNAKRFTVKGIHPQAFVRTPALLLTPKITITKDEHKDVMQSKKFQDILNHIKTLGDTKKTKKDIGRGTFANVHSKKKQPMLLKRGVRGMNWKLAADLEISSRIPPVLYLDTWEKNKFQNELLGPTKYDVKDFTKPYKTSGLMESEDLRFFYPCHEMNKNPGPGTYGGKLISEKSRKCPGRHAFLTNTRKSTIPGGYLAPNVYFLKGVSEIDKYINKVISARGPYDLFSGNRAAPNRIGWLPELELNTANDHQFVPIPKKIKGGEFSTVSRQTRPVERFACETNAHFWQDELSPGPADYSPLSPKSVSYNVKEVPFNKGSRRFEAMDARRFYGDYGVCGPGRYETKSDFCHGRNSIPHAHAPHLNLVPPESKVTTKQSVR